MRLRNSYGLGLAYTHVDAAVVWWQNSRLTVLYDLSGVLEPATRIAQGDLHIIAIQMFQMQSQDTSKFR